MKKYISIYVSLFAIVLLNQSCNPQIDYSLSVDVTKYVKDSFDMKATIGNKYKILNSRIKGGKVFISAIDTLNKSCFVIADIKKKAVEHIIENSTDDDYYSTIWDATSTAVIATSATKDSYKLFFFDFKGGIRSEVFDPSDWVFSSEIIGSGNQFFYLGGVYGVAFVDTKRLSKKVFKNIGYTTNPTSSTMSYPINDSLNLLSGHTISKNTMQLYAIDYKDSTKWKYTIQQNSKNEDISLLNFNNSFVIKYDSSLIALGKSNGKVLWHTILENSINKIYKWHDKVLVYCLTNPKGTYPDNDSFEYKITMKLFDVSKGIELWSNSFTSINIPDIFISDNNLLITDKKSLKVFSMDKGKETAMKIIPKKKENNYVFEMLTDIVSGNFYLKSFDGKIYW